MHRSLSQLTCVLVLAACGGDTKPTPGAPDAGVTADARSDAAPSQLATVTGTIRRSAQPMGDARGHVYVALFDRDPVANMGTAQLVARVLVENADLAAANATVAYQLADVPTRAEDYFLVAFLDDNANVNPANPNAAGPDKGDLVSLDGLASPKLKVASAGNTSHDIVLNSVLPF